jgi:hypothetical protein
MLNHFVDILGPCISSCGLYAQRKEWLRKCAHSRPVVPTAGYFGSVDIIREI